MNQAIRKRLEALERAALSPVAPFDWSALTAVEFEVYRAACTELAAWAHSSRQARRSPTRSAVSRVSATRRSCAS